jgi:AAA domain
MDLNDIDRDSGPDGVRAEFDTWKPYKNGANYENLGSGLHDNRSERANDGFSAKALVPRLKWLHEIQFIETSPYIVKNLIYEGDFGVLFGESGAGKTFFYCDLAFHIAMGREWRGLKVNKGSVLIVGLEGQRGLNNRLLAQRLHHDVADQRLSLAVWQAPLDFCTRSSKDAVEFVRTARAEFENPPLITIVDTLARAMGSGNENNPDDMGAFIKSIGYIQQELGTHVLVIHHIGKDSDRGPRGHSSLKAAADTLIEIERPKGSSVSVATVRKQKDGPEGQEFQFRLEPLQIGLDGDGDPVTSCIVCDVEDEGSIAKSRKLTPPQERALEVLRRLVVDFGEPVRSGHKVIPEGVQLVPLDLWRVECRKSGVSPNENPEAQRKAIYRAITELQAKKLAAIYEDKVWLCQAA